MVECALMSHEDAPASEVGVAGLLDAVPHIVVRNGVVESIGPEVAVELGCAAHSLLGALERVGTPLDNATFADLCSGRSPLRVRLTPELADRSVRLRRLASDGDRSWIEVRSLAHEFRLESRLRRSGMGHMLISPTSSCIGRYRPMT